MKLRRVEITGFKSFGKKTVLEFPDGLSAIVGANGSGKSNIIDAICFALGYPSRDLRATKAQELIHSGSISVPHANVSLRFQRGDEYFEVKRKVDKKGKSTYKLNSVAIGLDGLHDTLTKHSIPKDGYNIVMQNDVTRFIEIKPVERRKVVDQISGIAGYEEKKKKALEELAVVERRISDTNLILSEKMSYLEEVERDREVALKYRGMQDELKRSKSIYFYSSLYELEDEFNHICKRLEAVSKEKDIKIIELARVDEEIDSIEQNLDAITKRIINGSGGESGKIKGEIGALKSGIEKKQEEIKFLKSEIAELEARKKANLEKQKELKASLKEREASLKDANAQVKEAGKLLADKEAERERMIVGYDNSELLALEKRRRELSEALFQEKKSLTLLESEADNIRKSVEELSDAIEADKASLKNLEAEYAEKEREAGRLEIEAERAQRLFKELEESKNKLSELFQEFARVESEIKTVERMEAKMGESESLKLVISNKSRGYIGQVKELGKAPEKYRIALEVAAGNKSNCLVVKDDKAAEWYIEELRKQKIGRATFLPLNKIHGPELTPVEGDGIIGYAKDLIKCERRYQNVFDFVFGETLVVKNIETARRVGIGKMKMVTLDGDLIAKGGAMTGGYYEKAAMSFSSTADKQKSLESIKREIAALKEKKEGLEKKLAMKGGINIDLIRERKAHLKEKVEALRAGLASAQEELFKLERREREASSKKVESAKLVAKHEAELKAVEERMNADAFNEMKEAMLAVDAEIHEMKDRKFELQTRANSIGSEIANMRSRIEDIDRQCDEMDKSISKFKVKIQENIDQITESGKKLQEMEKKHSLMTEESRKFFKEQEALNQLLRELGEKKGGLEASIERLKNELNELEVRKAKSETKMEEIKASMEGLEPPSKKEMEGADLKELKRRIKELERELGAVEGVNLRAVDMYEELKKQYEEIKARNDKLYVEKEKIYDLIEAIEEKKKAVFFDSFYKVKENFEQIIADLYPSTEGRLLLENENDPFESGLVLQVKPRGREGVNIDSLSGGEKTLTALAFLMATQSVTPSPFYILDEVDASLDQENVLRLVNFLKNRGNSQFIMISHNPETIKHVDSVIGVHMQDGLSRIVGVDMQTAEA